MTILIFLLVSYVLFSITLMKLFAKAGEEGWKALVPGLNFIVMCKLVGRKSAYAALLLIPIVNIFIFVGLCVDLVRSFGKYEFWHSALAVIFPAIIFFMIGSNKDDKYLGPTLKLEKDFYAKLAAAQAEGNTRELKKLERLNPYRKGPGREWAEAIIFAVFAAAFIRMFLIEAYTIPTSSMESSLKVGDFLFVSKAHYGIRTPKTVLMLPLLHNQIPGIGGESYLSEPNLPFFRLPALQEVERYDPVVFNFPDGDSVYIFPDRTFSINDFRRGSVAGFNPDYEKAIRTGQAPLVVRPIDKKDHYIKRCMGLPGDSLQIVNRQVMIDGKPAENPTGMQFRYNVLDDDASFTLNDLDQLGINATEFGIAKAIAYLNNEQVQIISRQFSRGILLEPLKIEGRQGLAPYQLTSNGFGAGFLDMLGIEYENVRIQAGGGAFPPQLVEKIKGFGNNVQVDFYSQSAAPNQLFPHDEKQFPGWTVDNYGPIYIPQKGATVKISPDNISLYHRIITIYEGNTLEMNGDKISINGQETDSYTFQMNYYWMMGDNRHNSEDSRVWGFVPENHIVGKPLFIWFSTKNGNIRNGINWERLFSSANKM